nr:transposase [Candidatus Sigynarchaeota archaeon]
MYKDAPDLARRGIHVVCTDEKTGIQALEPLHLTLPVRPGLVERREQDYTRHGTLCLISNFNVASGLIITPSILQTRKNVDFAKHVATTVATDPDAIWIFVVDQLNVHKSEELVRFVAEECGICIDLGKKGKRGILRNQITRKAFLEDESHRIRFISTPKHCSWLNQVEIWFSILSRKLLKRGTFTSISDLEQKIQKFIEYYNKTMAKAFKWTYTGRPLATA